MNRGWQRVVGDGLFQHLGLFALVDDFMQQPEVVVVLARVVAEFEKVPAEQYRLSATAYGQEVISAVAFETALAKVLAARAVDKTAGVVVILQSTGLASGSRSSLKAASSSWRGCSKS